MDQDLNIAFSSVDSETLVSDREFYGRRRELPFWEDLPAAIQALIDAKKGEP